MANSSWRIARVLSFALYYSGALWLFERLDRGRKPGPRCTVLSYHRIADERVGYRDIAVSPEAFRNHIGHLTGRGYRFLTLHEYTEYIAGRLTLDCDSVLLTFDDGYRDNFAAALPILRAAGAHATIFVVTGAIEDGAALWWDRVTSIVRALRTSSDPVVDTAGGIPEGIARSLPEARGGDDRAACQAIASMVDAMKPLSATDREVVLVALEALVPSLPALDLMLTWDMLEKMREAGFDVGAHTVTHPMLSLVAVQEAVAEITGSKRMLEQRLGTPVTSFAYPYGKADMFTDETIIALENAGFACAFTTENGRDEPGAYPYRLRRNGMRDAPAYVLAVRMSGLFEHPALSRARSWIERRRG